MLHDILKFQRSPHIKIGPSYNSEKEIGKIERKSNSKETIGQHTKSY